jgi:hypothetical protein
MPWSRTQITRIVGLVSAWAGGFWLIVISAEPHPWIAAVGSAAAVGRRLRAGRTREEATARISVTISILWPCGGEMTIAPNAAVASTMARYDSAAPTVRWSATVFQGCAS